jgi:hypothetical protein
MATGNRTVEIQTSARGKVSGYAAGGFGFDLTVALISVWFIIGLFVDGWAHNHGKTDNTFFTPWHAMLYSGILSVGLFLAVTQLRNVNKGYAWSRALPKGYLLSLIGVVLFFAGGAFDFAWHSLAGFEASLEALLSPAHVILASAGVLIITGPIRAAWGRIKPDEDAGWKAMLPTIIALTVLLLLATFFTQYANIFIHGRVFTYQPEGNRYFWDVTEIAYIVFPAVLYMGFILFAVRRWRLPFGAVTLMLTVNAVMMLFEQLEKMTEFALISIAAPIAGLVADALIRRFRPTVEHPLGFRVIGVVVPFVLFGTGLGILIAQWGISWSIHMWLGSVFMGSVVGLGVSYLIAPPAYTPD